MNFNLSQTLIKEYEDYKNGKVCGKLLYHIMILKDVKIESTDTQKIGQFFEYKCIGTIPKGSKTPPECGYTKRNPIKPLAAYEKAIKQSENFHSYISQMNIEILDTSVYCLTDSKESGEIDFTAKMEWEELPAIVDLKYSGLLEDKWSEFGWEIDTLPYKRKLMIQAVHYQYLMKEITGEIMPFYFMVFSNKEDMDCKLIKVQIDPDSLDKHKQECDLIRNQIQLDIDFGFKAIPSLKECKNCPLFDNCEEAAKYPIIQTVDYSYSQV